MTEIAAPRKQEPGKLSLALCHAPATRPQTSAGSTIIGIISPSRRCHSYKTIQSTSAPTRRHTPELGIIVRFRKARQTNAQPAARHASALKHAQAVGEGRVPVRTQNRCQTKHSPENSSFPTRRHLFFVVNIMPIMCPCQQGRGFWEGLFRMVRSAWTILYMLWQGGASHTVRIHRLKIMG